MKHLLQCLRVGWLFPAIGDNIPTKVFSNNFGAARLLLATMIILSHSPELLDGDRSREPLSKMVGVTFGAIGIHGFFLISGFLIAQSFLSSSSPKSYMLKRVLRIFPGFTAAFLVSLLIVGPLGGGQLFEDPALWLINLGHLFLLRPPLLPTAFAGSHYASLNGSMWSISYEFRCYIAVLIVGLLGGFAHRFIILAGTLMLVAVPVAIGENLPLWPHTLNAFIGEPARSFTLLGVYACGVCFFLFRDQITFTPVRCATAAATFVFLARIPILASVAVETAGAYLLFAFVFAIKNRRLASIGSRVDLSYGIYLYAWPIQKLTIQWAPRISPTALDLATIATSAACAFVSWKIIEKPAMNLRRAVQTSSAGGADARALS